MSKADEGEEKKAEWVCAGDRLGATEHELVQLWFPLDKNGNPDLDERRSFGKKGLSKFARAGGVYEVTYTEVKREDGGVSVSAFTAGPKQPKYLYVLDNEKQTAEWRAEEEEAETKVRLFKKEKAELSEDVLEKCLRPIKEAYYKTDRVGRNIILASVISYITWGKKLKSEKP